MRRGLGAATATAVLLAASSAGAQRGRLPPPPPPVQRAGEPVATAPAPAASASGAPADFRARFGLDVAGRLLRSTDPDDRLRGLERVAATHTPEALAVLEQASAMASPGGFDPRSPVEGVARHDPRALLVVVRGLAGWIDREPAREALAGIVSAPTAAFGTHLASAGSRDPAADEAEGAARVQLAREEAAIALAESGHALAVEALIAAARSGGPGQAAALDALAIHPPESPLLGGVTLTTPATIGLATLIGDLRSIDAIAGAMHASDPGLRAAALAALALAGDARTVEMARAALHDREPRVRVAAADALVHLGAPDAPAAVEALVGDDLTVREGLRLAADVQGEGVARAVAARAAASSDAVVRTAAITALGRQTSAAAVGALATLAGDPALQGDAAAAVARSPSPAAGGLLRTWAASPATRRLAARAYLVRRIARGERDTGLDALLASLAGSGDARDRAVGVEALVALRERPLPASLADADARVRRAAGAGALARWDDEARDAVLARLATEADDVTRQVLAVGLVDGDAGGRVPTLTLADRADAGGPDAPLAALALARRADGDGDAKVDALLASRDPVLRAHAALGLGASRARDAVGRLARAYGWEADDGVRRALVEALAARGGDDTGAPLRGEALALAARLDPDSVVRWTARRGLAGAPVARRSIVRDVVWLHVVPAEGAAVPRDMTGALIRPDGLAVPFAFDEDGYALVPGVSPGEARVRLAPRLPAYEAAAP